ncbi:hypothetical protein ABW19_dt0210149 [Dactylella cylindrospora]|nr:hypothetical protein ABW19_dt0210149 [Dactylella cylindrospora]
MWYGWSTGGPQQIDAHKANGIAGKFAANSGEATGCTGMVVYSIGNTSHTFQVLFMMPQNGSNVVKVGGGFNTGDKVDLDQLKRMWYDPQFGTSTNFDLNIDGKNITFTLSGEIGPGDYNATAKYTLTQTH